MGTNQAQGAADERLRWSIDGLAEAFPEYSVRRMLTAPQRLGLVLAGLAGVLAAVRRPVLLGTVVMAVLIGAYTAMLVFRIHLLVRQRGVSKRGAATAVHHIEDAVALAIPGEQLPTVSILVPAYREPEVLADLVANLARLDYPIDRVEILLVLEEDDEVTRRAAATMDTPANVRIVVVPPGEPRTKPKACNYALLECTGDLVTIYDAEDRPEPLQLRRVAAAFARSSPEVACIQAELSFFNWDENVITRWFAVDYRVWFTQYLPGLAASDTPIPLGGTSNHMRRDVLTAMGGWDPYNVTEDADLGIRLHRRGYRVGIVDSITYEEANTDLVNWVKQRSRWYKGYLQTWLVHMRRPRQLRRELGTWAFLRFNLFVAGTPVLAALNPVSWLLVLAWFTLQPQFVKDVMPAPVYYAGLASWLLGNFTFYFLNLGVAARFQEWRVFKSALWLPAYWVMMSLAAVKALVQLVVNPNYWEKTQHGLSTMTSVRAGQVSDGVAGA